MSKQEKITLSIDDETKKKVKYLKENCLSISHFFRLSVKKEYERIKNAEKNI